MTPLSQMLGEAPGIVAVREQIARLVQRWREGPQRLPSILIQGETGTGKGLIAHVLHRAGPRSSAPFVDVDCAAIPETLLEAELFGVERGAFTDARQARGGLFQAAHGGMLFLDEVALLPLPLQAKLLKALEERVVRRLGGTRREPVDVWVVAAANEDLRAAAGAGGFREDLYHRLAVVTVRLPPLRERGDDILRLAEHFLARACVDYDLPPKVLTDGARAALLGYPWPGNVRELGNVMERVALLAEAAAVTAPMLDLPERPAAPAAGADHRPRRPALHAALAGVERAHLEEAMGAAEGNLSRAAARLGIPRNTLRYRLEKHGLTAAGAPPQRRARARPQEAAGGGTGGPGGTAGGLRWEPRRVTFLRAHLGGRPGAGGLDAGRAMEVVLEKVRSFGGSVEELAPSGVLAAFGALPLEDAPRHAGYAAAAIQKAAVRAGSEEATRPAVRLALHTEQLPVGQAASGTAVLDADAVRAAEEILGALLARAEMDTVVVSAPAAAFLRRRFELVPLGAVAGTAGPAYRLAGQAEPDRMLTPFVGREPELRLLAERFERARGGQGQVVSVVGEAGIGKSRLLRELRRHLGDAATWGEGHAIFFGRAMAFQALIDLLRRGFRIDEGDPEAAVIGKLERGVARLGEDLRPTLPFLRYLLSVDPGDPALLEMDPQHRRGEIFAALRRLFLRAAEIRPLVIVFEDAHWMDQATEEYVALLAEGLAARRVLLILTFRPGYSPPFGDRSYHTRLALPTLSTADTVQVARALLAAETLPEGLQTLIVGRAEGNPFFVEELVRSLLEAGVVGREEGRLVLTLGPDDLVAPDTVEDVILARIDRLDPALREILHVAAVIGKDLPLGLLLAVAGVPEGSLREGLRRLQAAEFLYERGPSAELEYTFKHALTHEVAYESLPPDRRRALHARIAEAMEALLGDRLMEQVERLAHHAFRGEVWPKAVTYLRRAGAKAFARSANQEAVGHLEQALEALKHLPDARQTMEQAIDLRFDLRNALFPLTELGRISGYLREADGLARKLGDRRRLGWVSAYTSSHLWMIGRSAEMRTAAGALDEIAGALGDFPLQVAAHYYLGAACLAVGDYRSAGEACRNNLRALQGNLQRESFGLAVFPAAMARAQLAWCLAERGEFPEGTESGEEGLRLAEALDHPFTLLSTCAFLAYLYRVKGDLEPAGRLLERALGLAREWRVSLWSPYLIGSLGHVAVRSGHATQGLSLLRQALAEYEAVGLGLFHTLITVHLGEAYGAARRLDEARASAGTALALARERGERCYEAWALRLLGDLAANPACADREAASPHYLQAMGIARELGMRPLLAHCHLGLGKLYRSAGKTSQAQEHLGAGITMYREMDMRSWGEKAEEEVSA